MVMIEYFDFTSFFNCLNLLKFCILYFHEFFLGMIEYSIIKGDPMHMFKIDKTSGSISVAKNLDYEDIPVYNIMIKAKDRGFYSRSATSSVKIFLADVNDNPPSFDQEFYRWERKIMP